MQISTQLIALLSIGSAAAFAPSPNTNTKTSTTSLQSTSDRKQFLQNIVIGGASAATAFGFAGVANAETPDGGRPESLDIENFLRTGQEAFPMGVSSQAGKSRPITGIYLRDGSEVVRDSRTGNVLAEIVVGERSNPSAVIVSYSSPWPLAKGTVFDVECRDAKTGDGAFLSLTEKLPSDKTLADISSTFFMEQLFAPTGRFSFYGAPTNIKVKKSTMDETGTKRIIDFSFANLSQSTNAEIPRNGVMVASMTESNQAVILVGSATSNRWKNKGAEQAVRDTIASFNASPSPKSSMKVRRKENFSEVFD